MIVKLAFDSYGKFYFMLPDDPLPKAKLRRVCYIEMEDEDFKRIPAIAEWPEAHTGE